MPLYLRLSIPPEVDEGIRVTNEGHPVTRDHPEHDDLRVYLVSAAGGSIRFRLEHRRGDGRHKLAAAAMRGVGERLMQNSGEMGDDDPDLSGPSMKYCSSVRICAEVGEGCMCSREERLAVRDRHSAGKTGDGHGQ